KGDKEKLETAVRRDARNGIAQDVELARLLCQPIKKDDVENDPANGQKSVGGTVNGGSTCHVGGHHEAADCNNKRCKKTKYGRGVRLDVKEADTAQQDDNRQGGKQCRQEHASQRVINLIPGHRSSLPGYAFLSLA